MAEPIDTRFPELAPVFTFCPSEGESVRFLKKERSTTEGVEKALRTLLKKHTELCPFFSLERLREKINETPFLTITGRAVCLSRVSRPIDFQMDDNLSGEPVQTPFRCSRGHLFDRSTILFWKSPLCPLPPDHALGTLDISRGSVQQNQLRRENTRGTQERLASAHLRAVNLELDELRREQAQTQELTLKNQVRERELMRILGIVTAHAHRSSSLTPELLGRLITDGTKVGAKGAVTTIPRLIATIASKFTTRAALQVARQAPKAVVFGIPGVGLVVGISMGIYRLCRRQWFQGTGEFLSGAASCLSFIPGLGSAAAIGLSVLIDAAVTAGDIYDAVAEDDQESVRFACQMLGIEFTKELKKADVDAAFQKCKEALDSGTSEQSSDLLKDLEAAKKRIYKYCEAFAKGPNPFQSHLVRASF